MIDPIIVNNIFNRMNTKTNVDFINRLKDPNRKYINLPDGRIATHRLGYCEEENCGNKYDVIFPSVQNLSNKGLFNFKDDWRSAYKSAVEHNDTIHVPSGYGEVITTTYKEHYPKFEYKIK